SPGRRYTQARADSAVDKTRHHPSREFGKSAAEARLRQALHAEAVDSKHAARRGLLLRDPLHRTPHACHVHDVQTLAAEHHAGQVADGEIDLPVDAAVRRVADDAAAEDVGVPNVALGINGRAIEGAGIVFG